MIFIPRFRKSRTRIGFSAASLGIVTIIRTLRLAGASPSDSTVCFSSRAEPESNSAKVSSIARPSQIFACNFVKQRQESIERSHHMGFQPAKRTKRQSAEVLLQFADVVPAQAHIVDEISRALKVVRINVIKF